MKLAVSREAARWYKEEMDLQQGDHIQFIVQIYGQSIHPNYSLGIVKATPKEVAVQTHVEGITFYFDTQDAWFLEGYQLTVNLLNNDVNFIYEKDDQ